MGPKHKAKSTRATRGRSVNSSRKPRRKERALREGIKSFLVADRLPRDTVHEPSKLRTDADARNGAPTMTLQMIQAGLETASALVSICADVLDTQMADSDRDVAIVLQRCVLNTLMRQQERIELLLKDEGAS